jgi:hypothetical protein
MPVDPEALMNRVNSLAHEVALLQLGLEELSLRLESVLELSKIDLARFEDIIRSEDSRRQAYKSRQEAGEEDLVGT